MGPAIAMRVVTFAYTSISALFNPVIYYYSRKDLREATLRLLGRRVAVAPMETSGSIATTRGTATDAQHRTS
jgi:hypothetical protein